MKSFILLPLLTILYSCNYSSSPGAATPVPAPEADSLSASPTVDSTKASGTYIGYVHHFDIPLGPEIYLPLYYKEPEGAMLSDTDGMDRMADSTIYQDEDHSRSRVPLALAKKYFDLNGLSTIRIYNKQHQFLCNAHFLRVEYFEQATYSEHIAVYQPEKPLKQGKYYAVNHLKNTGGGSPWIAFKDQQLTRNLLKQLNETPAVEHHGLTENHFRLETQDTILSVLNTAQFTYVVLSAKQYWKVLYKSADPENVDALVQIQFKGSQYPILLTSNVQPDTDQYWDQVLYFDGKTYVIATRQRLPFDL
jgi:hypothetical protein